MVYRVTAKFFFDNGQVKRVDWYEPNLVKKDSDEYLTREEAEVQFRAMFLKYMKDGLVFSVPNIAGKVSIVPFSKVHYIELSVEEALDYGKEKAGEDNE